VLATGMVFIAVALAWFSQVSVDGGYATDILGPLCSRPPGSGSPS
jgi:hypothetical protein